VGTAHARPARDQPGDDQQQRAGQLERRPRPGIGAVVSYGDARHLPFPDRHFDVTVSLRLLMHVPDWRGCLAELCRVTRRRLVFDYPARASAAALQAVGRRVLHGLGRPTEPYRVFADGAIDDACRAAGFRVRRRQRHFVLPIALHKTIGARGFTRGSEATLSAIGLTSLFGSPVTLLAERED